MTAADSGPAASRTPDATPVAVGLIGAGVIGAFHGRDPRPARGSRRRPCHRGGAYRRRPAAGRLQPPL
jgi:hypothetical protein